MLNYLEILDRAQDGPYITEENWDLDKAKLRNAIAEKDEAIRAYTAARQDESDLREQIEELKTKLDFTRASAYIAPRYHTSSPPLRRPR